MKRPSSEFITRKYISKLHPKPMPLEPFKNCNLAKLLKQAFILQTKDLYDSAVTVYEKVALSFPHNIHCRVNLAVCLIKLNMIERAVHILTQAQSLNPENFYIIYNKVLAFFLQKDFQKALKLINDSKFLETNKDLQELKENILHPRISLLKPSKSELKNVNFENKPMVNLASVPQTTKNLAPSTVKHRFFQLSIEKAPSDSGSASSLNSVASSISTKTITLDELVMKKEYISRLLHERETRLSIMENTPRYKPKTKNSNGFYQEDIEETVKETQAAQTELIKIFAEPNFVKNLGVEENFLEDSSEIRLSTNSIRFILLEFEKPVEERDYNGLIKRFKKLPFFTKFPKDIQRMLIEIAEVIKYEIGDVIIKQGDVGECMFVILKGSVNIHRKAPEYHNLEIIVNSIYDGEAFGELALLSDPKETNMRRTASCVAAETTLVVSISKQNYCSIILKKMHNNVIERIQFIKDLPLFRSQNWLSLIPFAASLEPKIFPLGEIVLEQGQVPEGMYILYKGQCKVYWEGYRNRPSTGKDSKRKPFFTGNYTPCISSPQNLTFRLTESIQKSFYSTIKTQQKDLEQAKAALILKIKDATQAVKERIEYSTLKEGDYFAGRTILDRDFTEPCKFTIVSESQDVRIFVITKKNLCYLGEDFLVELI